VFQPRSGQRALGVLAVSLVAGCASTPRPTTIVDLSAARAQLEQARQAASNVVAAQAWLTRAEEHLRSAESLVRAAAPDERARGAALSQLSLTETRCALDLAELAQQRRGADGAKSSTAEREAEAAQAARLRRSEAEEHRLEERVALLQRNLEMTETELIRTKARLKGSETKADASSAIAEARVLMRRALDARGRSASLNLCQEKLDRAEKLLALDNYGAALFFASQAQDLLGALHREPEEPEQAAPRQTYVVAASSANLRAEPSASSKIVARLVRGTSVEAQAMRGEWMRVNAQGAVGWVLAKLLK
jgi:outer membrane murein-binding lipoprotein Lpp/uncharacterized protein YgiM (DUF1202 family)